MSDNNKALDLFAAPRRHARSAANRLSRRRRRYLSYRLALGCAGVASVGSDRGPGVGAGRRPVPGRWRRRTRKRASSQRRDALWADPQHQALTQEDDANDDPIPPARGTVPADGRHSVRGAGRRYQGAWPAQPGHPLRDEDPRRPQPRARLRGGGRRAALRQL